MHEEQTRQQLERERERGDLLAMFQEEREQLIEANAADLAARMAAMRRKCERETDARVRDEVDRAEQKCLETLCRWKVEEALLKAFIDDAQKRQVEAVR